MTAPRITALAVAATVLAGCSLQIPFDCSWRLTVASPPGARVTALPMDLSTQEELWSRREKVDEVAPERVRLTVAGIGEHNQAEAVTLGLRYRADGAPESGELDLVVFERSALLLVAGESLEVAPPEGLGAALGDALRSNGRFTLLFESEAGAVVQATIDLAVEGKVVAAP